MHRRQFLATTALAAGLAGCPTGPVPVGGDRSATDSPPPETRPPAVDVTLRSALRYVVNNDAVGVEPPEAAQFAFVRSPAGAAGPPPDDFALELGDREFAPRSSIPGFALVTPGVESVYTDDERFGSLVFDVPTVDAASGALAVADGTRYPLPEAALARFAAAPALAPESVATPDAVTPDGSYDVTVTAANEGDRDGVFLAGLQRGGRFATVDVSVPPGGTESATRVLSVPAEPGPTEHFRFVWADGRETYEMPVAGGG